MSKTNATFYDIENDVMGGIVDAVAGYSIGRSGVVDSSGKLVMFRVDTINENNHTGRTGVIGDRYHL